MDYGLTNAGAYNVKTVLCPLYQWFQYFAGAVQMEATVRWTAKLEQRANSIDEVTAKQHAGRNVDPLDRI
jgi:hypothetical protein